MNTRFFRPTNFIGLWLVLNLFSESAFSQLLPRQEMRIDYTNVLSPDFEPSNQGPRFSITKEMNELIDHANQLPSPMERNFVTDRFLDRYYPYFQTRMMRNGDIAYLHFYYNKYLKLLEECLDMAHPHGLNFESTRRSFFKTTNLTTRKEKRKYWRKFKKKKITLIANFFQYRQYLIPALSTEVAMILQELHLAELAHAMNQLENLDGTPLEVTIYSNQQIDIPETKGKKVAGLSIISKCENVFTSGSPAVRDAYPGLRGSNKGLTVHLGMFEGGVTLSHELGHLYYLYYKWEEYVAYIERKGRDYEPGGHGPDDPSGLAAKMTEKGLMPF